MVKGKLACPQCGAQATPGRFCEYCGTKIPAVNNTETATEEGFNSWYDVLPQGYEAELDCYINGGYKKSKFLVVTSKDDGNYGIINQKGKFVVDCNNPQIILFVDNYDYIVNNSLWNVIDGVKYLDSIRISDDFMRKMNKTYVVMDGDNRPYDRSLKKYIKIPSFVFKKWEDFNLPYSKYDRYKHNKYKEGDVLYDRIHYNIEWSRSDCFVLDTYINFLCYFPYFSLQQEKENLSCTTFSAVVYRATMRYENGSMQVLSENIKSDSEIIKDVELNVEKILKESQLKIKEARVELKEQKKENRVQLIFGEIIPVILMILFLLGIVWLFIWPFIHLIFWN